MFSNEKPMGNVCSVIARASYQIAFRTSMRFAPVLMYGPDQFNAA